MIGFLGPREALNIGGAGATAAGRGHLDPIPGEPGTGRSGIGKDKKRYTVLSRSVIA